MAMTDREQTSDEEDTDLCMALARRDPAAFSELVQQYGPVLYRIALRFTGHRQDAEDVLQETLLKVVTKIDTVTDPAALPGWLRRVTVNAALMRLRSRNREPDPLDELPENLFTADGRHNRAVLPWPGLPEDAALRGEARTVLAAAVAELPDGSRAVYALADIEGLDHAEVAELLNISPGAVRMRLHRARLALREVLAGYFTDRTPTGGVAVAVPPTGTAAGANRTNRKGTSR
jgi:RNA polymerase sigma-70 factor (ECF subfamily)